MSEPLYIGNDHAIELRGLKDEISNDFLNAATVTVTLKDSAGANVSGASWPIAMTFITGTNGVYRATLPDELAIVDGRRYTAVVVADGGANKRGQWNIPCAARLRRL
jgi:hypothetical protein